MHQSPGAGSRYPGCRITELQGIEGRSQPGPTDQVADDAPAGIGEHERAMRNSAELEGGGAMGAENGWNWPPSMDAVVAAPQSHRVLFENDDVRVLEVTIPAGHREPEHTHREPSVMIVDGPARIHYYQGGALTFSSPADTAAAGTRADWMNPEGPHSVENVDTHPYHAIRVELRTPGRARLPD